MVATAPLYHADFVRWTEEQADALREAGRAGVNLPLDWENLAEEIESLGRQQRSELRNRIAIILEHLMKLEASPAEEPRAGWKATVRRTRLAVKRLLRDNPSLKPELPAIIAEEWPDVAALVAAELIERGELTPEAAQTKASAAPYPEGDVLGGWFPDAPTGAH